MVFLTGAHARDVLTRLNWVWQELSQQNQIAESIAIIRWLDLPATRRNIGDKITYTEVGGIDGEGDLRKRLGLFGIRGETGWVNARSQWARFFLYRGIVMVTDDVILEQMEYTYDAAGNVIQTISRQRYHNAPDTQQGALQNPSTTPKARVLYSAAWPDGIGRTVATATYGTNGGTTLSRPSTAPASSDATLVSLTHFDSAGNVLESIDPSGMLTRSNTMMPAGR